MSSLRLALPPEELAARFRACKEPRDLSALLDVKYERLVHHVYGTPPARKYVTFDIPKRAGGARRIAAPATPLKIIQRKLSQVLLASYRPPPAVNGFALDRSILTNAAPHAGRRIVVNFDLTDFFGTINFGRVFGLFRAKPFEFPQATAAMLANILCFENGLPQGAPSSPVVSNMICRRMDRALQQLAARRRYTYTRYADDITFSTWRGEVHESIARRTATGWEVGTDVTAILAANGFAAHPRKTRVLGRAQRQEVTGLVVNSRPNVPRRFRKQIRAMLHAWQRYGLAGARTEHQHRYSLKRRAPDRAPPDFQRVLSGKIAFLRSVVSESDPGYQRARDLYRALAGLPPIPGVAASLLENMHGNVWVVECGDRQGTAFRLENVGFVTCAHVLDGPAVAYRADNLASRHAITVMGRNDDVDLAVFSIADEPANLPPALSAATASVNLQDAVHVWGFPNHNIGDSVGVRSGHVAGFRNRHGIRRLLVNAPIIHGNSGGPVLDASGKVIGVAVTGAPSQAESDSTEEHGVIPMAAIAHVALGQAPVAVGTS